MLNLSRTMPNGPLAAVVFAMPRVVPGAVSGLALATLLGACGTVPPGSAPVAQEAAPPSQSRIDALVPAALKNAETAISSYRQSRKNEQAAREAVLAAGNVALVARHRYSIGTTDYVEVVAAEQRLAGAEERLKTASAEARAARRVLYRSFGFSAFGAMPVSDPAQYAAPPGDMRPL
jgi:hypothetical protein